MAYTMETTRYPGIFRRGSRYVVPYRHKGKQHRSSFRTLAEARAFKGKLQGGDVRTPTTRLTLEEYADLWLPTYQGRTSRGFTERTRKSYRALLDRHAMPYFGRWRMAEVRKSDVRAFVAHLQAKGLAPATVKKILVPLAAMFATAHEDDEIPSNPVAGVRINFRREIEDGEDEPAKSLTMAQIDVLMGHVSRARRAPPAPPAPRGHGPTHQRGDRAQRGRHRVRCVTRAAHPAAVLPGHDVEAQDAQRSQGPTAAVRPRPCPVGPMSRCRPGRAAVRHTDRLPPV